MSTSKYHPCKCTADKNLHFYRKVEKVRAFESPTTPSPYTCSSRVLDQKSWPLVTILDRHHRLTTTMKTPRCTAREIYTALHSVQCSCIDSAVADNMLDLCYFYFLFLQLISFLETKACVSVSRHECVHNAHSPWSSLLICRTINTFIWSRQCGPPSPPALSLETKQT